MRVLLTLLVLCTGNLARAVEPDAGPCRDALWSDWAYAREVARLVTEGYMRGEDVAGLVALSQNDVRHLLAHGELESPIERIFFPFTDNALVAYHLDEHPGVDWNGQPPAAQSRAAADRAWELTMMDATFERLAKGGVPSILDEGQVEMLVQFLRPAAGPGTHFGVSLDDIAKIPEVISTHVPRPHALPEGTRISRDLARRLNLGPDLADLKRWARLTTVADLFHVGWSAESYGPDLERALSAHFARVPREAGVVVALSSRALAHVVWSESEWPVLSRLALEDLTGIESHGTDEAGLLRRLANTEGSR